jgi:PilZ domain
MRLNVNRRRARRRSLAVWTARYRLDPSQPWCSCRVLDVSETGIGLELHGPVPPNGASLILDLEQRDLEFRAERQSRLDKLGFAGLELDKRGSIGAELPAVVRHAVESTDGVRVGAEFTHLTPLERSVLALLLEREALLATR